MKRKNGHATTSVAVFMIMPPDMVIFDCDGVLVDSEMITNRVMQASLAEHGLPLEIDDIMDLFVGGTMQGVMDLALSMGAKLPGDWLNQMYSEMHAVLAREVEPVAGAIAVLDALDAAGIPYAIGSNGPHAKMAVTLPKCGLQERFEGRRFSREDVANPKPAPDVYLKAASEAGIVPSRCVVIEDSANGAKAGVAAGMFTIGFHVETPKERLASICDALFANMSELPTLLGLKPHSGGAGS